MDAKKRTMGASERDEQARTEWKEQVKQFDPKRMVFVDECGSSVSLAPIYARAPRGARALGSAPRNWGRNITLIASMSALGMGEAMTVEGATDTVAFELYIERLLAPSLGRGQVVVMDNLSAHKSERDRHLIAARGCQLLYLPAYSPDLNPIEQAFSKLKGMLRQARARTKETLELAISEALSAVTASDALGWFRNSGYPAQ
ncbi:MAG: IS630 family transposase [Chloroflexota bacterium]|nr:IS630 family transposase [Chloroflexota bacterium]